MSWPAPNLAARPFLNLRPARRAGGVVATAALLLAAWNVKSTWRAGTGEANRRTEIAQLAASSDAAQARIATIERDLAMRDLATENRRAEFLNERIVQRTFGWNLLFDRLGHVLPRGVRLRRLSPKALPAVAAPPGGGVMLEINGEAEDDESMLEFVDKLFDDPAFEAPDLHRESHAASGALQFSLTVHYLPGTAP